MMNVPLVMMIEDGHCGTVHHNCSAEFRFIKYSTVPFSNSYAKWFLLVNKSQDETYCRLNFYKYDWILNHQNPQISGINFKNLNG